MYKGKLSHSDFVKCWEHAYAVHVARADQDKANNDEGEHRKQRKFIGKTGEVGAVMAGYPGVVDFDVWDRPLTGPDLGFLLYVKTCSATEAKNGVSWLIDKDLFYYPHDKIVVLAVADLEGSFAVLGHVDADKLLGRYGNPRSKKVRGRKNAVWLDDARDPVTYDPVKGIRELIRPLGELK
jgi:hypothetical protein